MSDWDQNFIVTLLSGFTASFGLLVFLLARWGSRRALSCVGLLGLLVGFYFLFVEAARHADQARWVPFALLAGSLGVFKLMSMFETS